jgi:hypothetical protein
VRVVLLSRPAGLWWQGLRHRLDLAGLAADQTPLGPLPGGAPARPQAFTAAVQAFAELLPDADPAAVVVPELGGDRFGLVLTVHMAALAAVDATRHRQLSAPQDPVLLSAYLLDREHAAWQQLHTGGAVSTPAAVMSRIVYTATLTRHQPYGRGAAALVRAGVAGAVQAATPLLDDHATCYPPAEPATVLEPLYPDRLAEDFIALQTPGHQIPGYTAAAWAGPAAGDLLIPTRTATLRCGPQRRSPYWWKPPAAGHT